VSAYVVQRAQEAGLYLGGEWREASGDGVAVINPATEEIIATVPAATGEDVNAALTAARAAQAAWQRKPAGVRGQAVRGIAEVIRANVDELAELLTAEVGKPLAHARGELAWAADYADYMAGWDRRIEGEIVQSDNPDEAIHLVRVPLGVVAAITAWNFPMALFVRKVAPALVTGNAVVLKPSELTPLSTLALTRMLDAELDLPAGILNLVVGGPDVGRALVAHPQTNMVTFTGHRDTGKAIMVDAAQNLTRVSLELGGKAPAIVWADADLDQAVEAVSTARHTNSGQVCTCAERVIVHAKVYDEFVERYTHKAESLRLGDPRSDVDLGPLASAGQYRKAVEAIESSVGDGATLTTGGGRPQGAEFQRGYWVQPTVLTDVRRDMQVMREEVFGPVTPIACAESIEEAFEIANETRYGLSAFMFTSDYRTAMRAARDLDFGELYINRTHGEQVQAHHSGHKESGLGGEDGKHGVLRYTQLRSVYHYYG
jgi:lactaldehyde dehydrogenase/glycolaldehyde dehydrogenase